MKSFFRTGPGKLILIIVCTLSVLLTGVCMLGASCTISAENGEIHLRSRGDIEPVETEYYLQVQSWHVLEKLLNEGVLDYNYLNNINIRIWDADSGNWLYEGTKTTPREYQYRFFVYHVEDQDRIAWTNDEIPSIYQKNYRTIDVFASLRDNAFVFDFGSYWVGVAYRLGWWILAIAAASFILGVVCYTSLLRVSARKPGRDDLVPGPLHRLPFDLLLAAGIAALIGLAALIDWILPIDYMAELYFAIGAFVTCIIIFLGLSMSAAARIKTKTLLSNMLTVRLLKLAAKPFTWLFGILKTLIRNLPLMPKTAVCLLVLGAAELFVVGRKSESLFFLCLLKLLILIPAVLYLVLCLRRLQKGGEALAAGDLAYQTNVKGMPSNLKKHGENLNSIGSGMAIAVEQKLKSERMKTELITNVSHDLKTPLTSLVNYADLIGREPCENAKIKEYSEVLLRQSERLKRLIDDLVEASKASSGSLDVSPTPCDASVFLSQAAGEYEEKLKAAGLTLIMKQPEQEVRIMADGRRMWRIFDNLMNNIVKYGLAGSRVYLSLEKAPKAAVITFRNTSREVLDMNADELTERFTRGDASRNTEGSGLGLAIAKSLTELQGGHFSVTADGDLFKVILSFPLIGADQ